ncbi:two-component sensor histidine kinase [Arcticibacter svalbardensis MN12-7]|uniref:histidine kinase n=1 Tax=Arcticibacter svalbardensis MN12-7 TaxID=1150600 RepID=R9GNK1_9SPHI|nr:ATP-binding protein [Arcticibacter svalbardensis]EOR93100.1 two-component sensor histidine kinase [Arcticibacter svalbardensis MN12-7]
METNQRAIVISIVVASVIIVILAVFTILFFMLFIKKKRVLQHEKEIMKAEFEQTLLQSQLEIQEQTLLNISQEIHDNIGQVLSLVSLNLNLLKSPDTEKLATTTSLVEKAINDLRNLSKILNPERVMKIGLKEALELELHYLKKSGKYLTSMYVDRNFTEPDSDKTIILYRMSQEVLNNIMKHSGASEINVELTKCDQQTKISFRDNGTGFITDTNHSNGLGLQNIHKRASLINTMVDIDSKPGEGVNITFTLN